MFHVSGIGKLPCPEISEFWLFATNSQQFTKDAGRRENEDEMSLLMMLGKAQAPEDVHRLIHAQKDKVDLIMKKAPEHVLEIIASTVWSLCMKMNMPQTEAEQYVEKVRERQMGYWFENMEKMDIQEERRNTAKARAEAARAKEKAKEDVARAKEKVKAEALERNIQSIVSVCKKYGASKEQAAADLMERCQIDQETAKDKVNQYWESQANVVALREAAY